MSKQTAVHWLESIMNSMIEHGADFGEDYPALLQHIEQAKEIEKEQIMSAYGIGEARHTKDGKIELLTAEEYYNVHYGK